MNSIEKAIELIKYAYNNSPFYKEYYDANNVNIETIIDKSNIESLPIVTKDILRQNSKKIIVDKFKALKSNSIKVARTSGSTGKMIEVYWSNDDYLKSILSIWRKRKEWYGISPDSKCVVFNNSLYSGSRLLVLTEANMLNRKVLSLNKNFDSEEQLVAHIEKINEFKPDWIQIQPSIAIKLVELLQKYKIKILFKLKYLELNGEMVTTTQKNYISKNLSVPVANMYGANEVNSIALECPRGNMHLLNDNVYVELSENSSILVTSLHNKVFPIIRYDLGDIVTIKHDCDCCNQKLDIVDVINGRTMDYIILSDNNTFSPYFIIHSIERVSIILHDSIIQFKIEQKNRGEIIIYLKIRPEFNNWSETIAKETINEIYKYVSPNLLKITIKNNFIDYSNGAKFKVFIRSEANE
ncbi:MAG: phenylacetate--CoA ligase family protein [Clostridiales bacterium]|nr:phenylacetate--CoA ligase family protein [Clostridiales bacterium]